MDNIPDEKSVSAGANLPVYDASGSKIKFGELFREHKTIVVFIREYFIFR